MTRQKRKAKRPNRTEQRSFKDSLKWILEVMLFSAVFIGGAKLIWNSLGGPIQTGRFLTLENLGFFMLGVGGLRLQMLLFPKWTEKQTEKDTPSRNKTRFGGHWADHMDE